MSPLLGSPRDPKIPNFDPLKSSYLRNSKSQHYNWNVTLASRELSNNVSYDTVAPRGVPYK